MALHHVNFHTLNSKPIFEDETYDRMMRTCLHNVLRERQIICLAWEIMPTHVHLIIEDFPDLPRPRILQYLKGDTSRAFLVAFPHLRADLLGGHLWTKGYYAVRIISYKQFLATLRYVRANRQRADLQPPESLEHFGNEREIQRHT